MYKFCLSAINGYMKQIAHTQKEFFIAKNIYKICPLFTVIFVIYNKRVNSLKNAQKRRKTMSKSQYVLQKLCPAFLTTACQYILFTPIFVMYLFYILWVPIPWILIVSYILFPLISAYICCFLINRRNFHFNLKNKASKASVHRLISRMLSVICFLLIGYYAGKQVLLFPVFISDLFNIFGENAGTLESLLTNIFFYILVAIFPITYAFTEYLFVPARNE